MDELRIETTPAFADIQFLDRRVYEFNASQESWTPAGNVFGSATPAKKESWGRLKARYR